MTSASASTSSTPFESVEQPTRVPRAVVWLREGDLRLHDHPGLSFATAHTGEALALLLVITPFTRPETLRAVTRLRTDLHARGSALFLRTAESPHDEPSAVLSFVTAFNAQRVHVCSDVEAGAREAVATVAANLPESVRLQTWQQPLLRDWQTLNGRTASRTPREFPAFCTWRGKKRPIRSDFDYAPPRIYPGPGELSPALAADLAPSSDDISIVFSAATTSASTTALSEPEDITRGAVANKSPRDNDTVTENSVLRGDTISHWTLRFKQRASDENELTSARTPQLEAVDFGELALLDFLQTAERDNLPDLGRSFAEVFRQGALSARRMHQLTVEFERSNGRLWPFVYREAAKLVMGHLEAREFSTVLARDDLKFNNTVDGVHRPRFWRWNGFLIRYIEEGTDTPWAKRGAPPVLLVHGFGASSQHFGKSMRLLKENFHVFAVDLVGFGQSEKPPTQYTPAVWENMVWDFVREVVQRPVYVAGNSIGGYISCAFGVDAFPALTAGICLINSAGRLYEPDGSESQSRGGPLGLAQYAVRKWRWVRLLAARALLKQLQGRIGTTLQKVYPKRGVETDGELAREIRRASLDYGAVEVLCSGLITPQPRSIEALLRDYDGPLLVFNGQLDPLGDVPARTDRLAELYPSATVVRVDAGHCPHDEEPEQFADAISAWVLKSEAQKDNQSTVGLDGVAPLATS